MAPSSNNPDPDAPYEYSHLLPSFPEISYPPLGPVPYEDKGLLGSPTYHNLLASVGTIKDVTPKIGTEITGLDLAALTDVQKNDLARLIAHRGVVVIRGQKGFTVEQQLELGRYFGVLHKHATTAVPRHSGLEEIHVVYADQTTPEQSPYFPVGYFWHSDVTYELQPPSYTSLKLLTCPPKGAGGDTLWSSGYAAYDLLSTPMQKYLESLTALHSAEEQAASSRELGRHVRREPIVTEHPIIRTHPVTGWKSLFINPGFVRSIVGVPRAESDTILAYLNKLIMGTLEIQVRFSWGEGDIAFWDNRCTNHSATFGFWPHIRHAVRVTPHGERPTLDEGGRSQEEVFREKGWGRERNRNGARLGNYND
ncbi:hypothetical protein BDZ91DRAFT_776575 [Kalaharituber pfeilii]|nr:hypothetical protein BDZ91DRAFT_776575 [Kalaharituber pfeilii]